jgi:ubiquinone/menaquinone biosynthesis C-methylase UbiE
MATARPADYLPAARFDFLTPVFDVFVRATTRERAFKQRLLEQAGLGPRMDVLDLGSGTGTLAIWAKQRAPEARIRGLDGDPAIIAQAVRKAARAGVEIPFDEGLSYELPYEDGSFDRVLSSLFFHHLVRHDKERTIAEIVRVLRPGGELHVADFGEPRSLPGKAGAALIRRFDGDEATRDNLAGRLPGLFEAGGLSEVRERDRVPIPLGIVSLYSARRAG